jgi:hypothetical protein
MLHLGGDERTRTADPLLAKQVLYQLSYVPGLTCGDAVTPRRSPLPQVVMVDVQAAQGERHLDDLSSLQNLLHSFQRSMRATNLSPRTIATYSEACRGFTRFLLDGGMPTSVSAIKREHVEEYIEALVARWKPATAKQPLQGPPAVLPIPRRGRGDR